jgi:hypothetical protein
MTKSGLRPLSIGEILDGTFTLYRGHFGALVLVAASCGLPGLVADLALPTPVAGLIAFLGGVVSYVALTWMAAEIVFGREVQTGSAISFGVRNAIRVVACMIGLGLVMMLAVGFAGGLAAGAVTLLYTGEPEAGRIWMMVAAGTVGGIVFSYLFVRYFAVYQIVVLEGEKHFQRLLKRSALLARGAFWKISTVWTLGWIVVSLPWMLVGAGAAFTAASGGGLDAAQLQATDGLLPAVMSALGWLVTALTAPFTAALGVLLYLDQRVRKDGLDVELVVAGIEGGAAGPGKSRAA